MRHWRHIVDLVNHYRYRSLLENQGSQQGPDLTRIGDHDLSIRSSQNNHFQGGVSGVIHTAARRRVSWRPDRDSGCVSARTAWCWIILFVANRSRSLLNVLSSPRRIPDAVSLYLFTSKTHVVAYKQTLVIWFLFLKEFPISQDHCYCYTLGPLWWSM